MTWGAPTRNGGPATIPSTWWVARAAKLAVCQYTVSDARPIDNLRGPTFWLIRTSADECIEPGGGYGCDESWATLQRHNEYAWVPVIGTLAPHAAFIPAELSPGVVLFENISEPYATGTTTWEWTFGDGATSSTVPNPVHTYDEPGEYTVRLTMRSSAGPSNSAERVVKIKPPELIVSVYDPEAEYGPGKSGNRYSIGDVFTARIVLTTDLGLGDLTDVHPTGDLLTFPFQVEPVDPLPTIAPMTLGSNARGAVRDPGSRPGPRALQPQLELGGHGRVGDTDRTGDRSPQGRGDRSQSRDHRRP